MREFRNVRSTVKPNPIVIDEYSVWINSNITEDGDEYVYDQVQYSKDEYILKINADMEYIAMMSEVDFDE